MKFIRQKVKSLIVDRFNQWGYIVQFYSPYTEERSTAGEQAQLQEFYERSDEIAYLHSLQTKETVALLQQKYQQPIVGEARVWDLIQMLGSCIDPWSPLLFCTSQLIHVLQVLESMEQHGEKDPDLYLVALLHELGKIALLKGEAPQNVEGGGRKPVGEYEKGIGLDNCTLQFGHGEIVYLRLKDYVPDHIAWLLRYHDMIFETCEPYLDERDRAYAEQYYHTFSKHDRTVSYLKIPTVPLEKYRDMVEKAFPNPILF